MELIDGFYIEQCEVSYLRWDLYRRSISPKTGNEVVTTVAYGLTLDLVLDHVASKLASKEARDLKEYHETRERYVKRLLQAVAATLPNSETESKPAPVFKRRK